MFARCLFRLLRIVAGALGAFLAWLTLVRIVRHFYKFPMPEFMANVIDNPMRRKIQPPAEMPLRHGLQPGMQVLEVGPGNGRYTVATARHVGPKGKVTSIDIEPKMIARLQARLDAEQVTNVDGRLADVYALPYEDGAFDAAYMITVIGEIPDPVRAMCAIHRVLKPAGTLAFSELLLDPDYPLASTLVRHATAAGFRLKARHGNFVAYSLVFEKAQPHTR
ncbi:MAG: class I SAM-dependent methyltransferase [Chloroflexota bacterium]